MAENEIILVSVPIIRSKKFQTQIASKVFVKYIL